ncbi:MAG: Uma2 family endonuclease [Armatimonadaceae bacterium]
MSAVPKRKLTVAEYLAIEKKAEFKSEFFNGEMFAMAGASRQHNRLKDNMVIRIGSQLLGGPCQTFSSDQRVLIDRTGLYCYPDLLIVCGEVETADDDEDTITNPRVVIEVLSPTTERYDRGAKFRGCRSPTSTPASTSPPRPAARDRFTSTSGTTSHRPRCGQPGRPGVPAGTSPSLPSRRPSA